MNSRAVGVKVRRALRKGTTAGTPRAAGPGGMTVVDVVVNDAAGHERSNHVTVPALPEGAAQATGATFREQARYEREVAALDLTDAAQAMARSQPKGDVDAPVDSSQVDLATALYASADRHRRLAEGLESGSVAPVVPDELR